MTALEARAREEILSAAARLAAEGLIERTWGNISARVSDTQFLITPSGLAYETLREDQLVTVNIADASWQGNVKPSSEKGIHADAYRLRPEAGFVIHTHQYWASIAGVAGTALKEPQVRRDGEGLGVPQLVPDPGLADLLQGPGGGEGVRRCCGAWAPSAPAAL